MFACSASEQRAHAPSPRAHLHIEFQMASEFRVWGLGFGVECLMLRVRGERFRVGIRGRQRRVRGGRQRGREVAVEGRRAGVEVEERVVVFDLRCGLGFGVEGCVLKRGNRHRTYDVGP